MKDDFLYKYRGVDNVTFDRDMLIKLHPNAV